MLRTLFFKEIRQISRDKVLRACVVALLTAVSASAILGAQEYARRHRDYVRNADLHRRAASLNNAYRDLAWEGMLVDREPNVMSVLVRGVDHGVPSSVTVSLGSRLVNELDYRLVQNQWSKLTGNFDYAFIVLTFMSLMSILVTYRSISGEREHGTLRLLLSNGVSKWHLLSAKTAAALCVTALPLAVVTVLTLLTCALLAGLTVTPELLARAAAIWFAAALYTLGFALLGIWCSTAIHRPTGALAFLMLLWATMVFVVPPAAIVAASAMRPLPSRDELLERKQQAADEQWLRWSHRQKAYEQSHGHAAYYDVSGQWLLDRELGIADSVARIEDEYQAAASAQILLAVRLARASPAFALFEAVTNVAQTGLGAHARFVAAVRAYRHSFSLFMVQAVKRDPVIPDPYMTLDLSALPSFIEPPASAERIATDSLPSIAVLVIACVGAMLGAMVSLSRASL